MIKVLRIGFTSLVSVLLSVALGAFLCWSAAVPLIDSVRALRVKQAEEKRAKGWDFWTIEMENLANELKEERARLRQQSDLLDQRAARLASEESELAKIRAEIDKLRQEIAAQVIEISTDEAKNIRTLAATYTNLSPRAAVAILREMDDVTAVKILAMMKPDVVGPIFEEMSRAAGPDDLLSRRAAVLSEKLRLMKSGKPANPT